MARPPSPYRKPLVEDCEVICVSTAMGNLALYGITIEYTRGGRGGHPSDGTQWKNGRWNSGDGLLEEG